MVGLGNDPYRHTLFIRPITSIFYQQFPNGKILLPCRYRRQIHVTRTSYPIGFEITYTGIVTCCKSFPVMSCSQTQTLRMLLLESVWDSVAASTIGWGSCLGTCIWRIKPNESCSSSGNGQRPWRTFLFQMRLTGQYQ